MAKDGFILGIDSGSAAVATVLIAGDRSIAASDYRLHGGKAAKAIAEAVALMEDRARALGKDGFDAVAATASVPALVRADFRVDARIAYVEASRRFMSEARTLIVVGAERFARIAFDENGRYRRMRGNSACAAGTGSFLDQQATRLGLSGSAELAELALSNTGAAPRIASRCSVFAKTDLIHAQQEGWTLAQICDGLCRGLARNIADTLFPGEQPESPILLAGGVSLNGAVVRHLSEMAGSPVRTDPRGALFGAAGAAYRYLESAERGEASEGLRRAAGIVSTEEGVRTYANAPLSDASEGYPEFTSLKRFLFTARKGGERNPVETDIYENIASYADADRRVKVMLGFDIGSTSTKAALLGPDGSTLAGFYTRTAGRPLEAAQSVLEAAESVASDAGIEFDVTLCATTGSGRKLVGAVLGADASVDEITAHARAAVLLDPEIDTIIEIGGQDSKFTSIKDGTVVFSQMNTVCAAGTGSFIEEQAARLGVPITEYAERALKAQAPLTSDRCTVFMERDLNHLRATGYETDELLAAALYSVCDNYLTKVAREGAIGDRVVFQGATAKNKALVAAFERRLGKRIRVSRFCHLTGAVGAALQARDERGTQGGTPDGRTTFRGLSLHKNDFTFRPDECDGCNNRCKLHVVDVNGEEIVYGYLCGREKGDKTYVSKDKSGFDLLRERAAAFRTAKRRFEAKTAVSAAPAAAVGQATGISAFARSAFAPLINAQRRASEAVGAAVVTLSANAISTLTDAVYRAADYAMDSRSTYTPAKGEAENFAPMPSIGIPRALYLAEDAPYWQYFFEKLGFPVLLGDEKAERLAEGKRTAGAEFCAPVAMLHGQAAELLRRADYVFLPTYLEAPAQKIGDSEGRRYYCNYSQFAPAVVSLATGSRERFLRPLATASRGDDSNTVQELREAIRAALEGRGIPVPPPSEIRQAYRESRALKARTKAEYRELFLRAAPGGDDIAVLLAGRPYTLLSPGMNKGIPDIFAKNGVRAFFQDMAPLPPPKDDDSLLVAYHWRYAAEVLEAARFCALSESHYAVLVSSFKCSPDSFAAESFKRILDEAGKPYLVLQVDEHDSSVGYETRIEAAVRAFRNHAAGIRKARMEGRKEPPKAAAPESKNAGKQKFPKHKTVLLPNWDPVVCNFLAAALRSQGIDARELEETPDAIRRAMTLNAGQCIPVSIIAREAIDYIEAHALDPEKTALWMIQALWPCNIPLYPLHVGGIFEKHGKGLEKVEVYAGDITFIDLSPQATMAAFHAFLTGGLIRKLICRVRPYETVPGAADAAAARAQKLIADALECGVGLVKAVKEAAALFKAIPTTPSKKRPKVAIFGDFYSRDNETFNQDLGKAIEAAGGEVIVTPYIDYLKATCDAFFDRLILERRFGAWATYRSVLTAVASAERSFYAKAGLDAKESGSWSNEGSAKAMETFGLRPEMEGECMDNALKILRIVREHPDVALLVQANPAFCCPSIITEAMAGEIERVTGVPVVTITYDGTGSPRNDSIMPYLAFAKEREPVPPL